MGVVTSRRVRRSMHFLNPILFQNTFIHTHQPQPSSRKVAPGIWWRYVLWMYSAVQSDTGQTMVPVCVDVCVCV